MKIVPLLVSTSLTLAMAGAVFVSHAQTTPTPTPVPTMTPTPTGSPNSRLTPGAAMDEDLDRLSEDRSDFNDDRDAMATARIARADRN